MLKRILVMLLALLLCGCALAETATEGSVAPDFDLTTLTGEAFRLSEQRGKVVFINLWASWCMPCVVEMPDIQRFYEAHPDGLSVIGVSLDASPETVKAYLAEYGFTYPIAMDTNYALTRGIFYTRVIPMSVFISPEGVVTYMGPGMLRYEDLEALYQQARGNG